MWVQIIGAAAGVLHVLLMMRQNEWGWPLGLFYIAVSYMVFFQAHLYAELLSHTFYLIMTFYGWYVWRKKTCQTTHFKVRNIETSTTLFLVFLNAVAGLSFGFALSLYTNNPLPYIDALLATLSLTAMALQAHKKLESWIVWGVVNAVSIGLYLSQRLYLYAALYLLFFALSIRGFRAWAHASSRLNRSRING